MPNRYVGAGLALVTLAVAACGDSTAPHPVTPAQLAQHIDSLVRSSPAYRSSLLGLAVGPPASGVSPVPVVVTTRSGAHRWQGFVSEYVDKPNTGWDSVFVMYVYSDYDFTNFVYADAYYLGQREATMHVWVLSDTTFLAPGSGSLSLGTVATGGACSPVRVPSESYFIGSESVESPCVLATFTTAVTWSFPNATGAAADYQTVTISPTQLHGMVLQ
jgi:hypothetical protein